MSFVLPTPVFSSIRLWSALQFVYCLPPEQGELPPQEMYGDGIVWAGATLIHLLGQRHRFDTFDFSYYIQNMEEAAAAPTEDAPTKAFLKNVSQARDFNRVVFNILQTYFPAREAGVTAIEPPGGLIPFRVVSLFSYLRKHSQELMWLISNLR